MKKEPMAEYKVPVHRLGIHAQLDSYLDSLEKDIFIEGRKSAIEELMPHTVQFQKVAKAMKKTKK